MSHNFDERQISAYIDGHLSGSERDAIEVHFRDCERCRIIRDELLEVSDLFRKAERFEPSPYLWNRIAADFESERLPARSRMRSFVAGLRSFSGSWRLATAALAILAIVGIMVYQQEAGQLADRAALADIDRTYKNLAALDPDTYNPFGSGLSPELDTNPFKSLRTSSKSGVSSRTRGIN